VKLFSVRVNDEWWLGVDAQIHGLKLIEVVRHERALFQDRAVAVSMVRAVRRLYGRKAALVRVRRKV